MVASDRGCCVLEDQVDGDLEAVLEGPGVLEAVLELELEGPARTRGRQDQGPADLLEGRQDQGPANFGGRPRGRFRCS